MALKTVLMSPFTNRRPRLMRPGNEVVLGDVRQGLVRALPVRHHQPEEQATGGGERLKSRHIGELSRGMKDGDDCRALATPTGGSLRLSISWR